MSAPVKRDFRAERRAKTEGQLVAAATDLFLERGWAATTLAEVANRAGVAERTLYVRFPSKADLLHRCIDVAIAADQPGVPLDESYGMSAAMTAPSRDERIDRMAALTAALMARAGRLVDVARQAAPSEPTVAARAEAARSQTRNSLHGFWRGMAADGLLPPRTDVEWLAETGSLLAQPETFLLLTSTTGWDVAAFERWLAISWRRLVTAAAH